MNIAVQSAQAFEQYRWLLFSLAYRMLGSVSDAEDIVQEAFVRWLEADVEDVRAPKAYLSKIVVRLCINQAESARVQREVYPGTWLPEPLMLDQPIELAENAMQRETLSFAFLVLLEKLGPLERAVFLLREAFEYSYVEIAAMLDKSEASCRQLLHRAHHHLEEPRPRFNVSPEQQTRMLERFLNACTSGNMQELLTLLAEDIVFTGDGGRKVPTALKPVHGKDKVARGTLGSLRLFPTEIQPRIEMVNGQLAIVGYLADRPFGVVFCEIEGEQIRHIYVVLNSEKLHGVPMGFPHA